jgi:hypothetical protein
MKRLTFFITLFLILTLACSKDEFPDEFSIIGAWIESTSNNSKAEIEFKTGNRAFRRSAVSDSFDTLMYRLDKKDELQLFSPAEYPNGIRSTHKLGYSQKKKEITIYNLFPSIPDSPPSIVFKRK